MDSFFKLDAASWLEEKSDNFWKPVGTIIRISGRWASREMEGGSNALGRWSWITLKGKK